MARNFFTRRVKHRPERQKPMPRRKVPKRYIYVTVWEHYEEGWGKQVTFQHSRLSAMDEEQAYQKGRGTFAGIAPEPGWTFWGEYVIPQTWKDIPHRRGASKEARLDAELPGGATYFKDWREGGPSAR